MTTTSTLTYNLFTELGTAQLQLVLILIISVPSIDVTKQAGAELGQAQVKLDDIVVVVLEVVVKAMVEVEFQLLFRV